MSNEEMLKETASELKGFLSTKNVMGDPVDFGDKLVVPVARYGFGFGAGGSHAKDGGGQGAGAGGGIEPVALVILHKDVKGAEGVQVMSLKKDSQIAQVISAISESLAPQLIDAIKTMHQDKKEEKKEKS
ncbi:MAG: spore germination protein GerW family protein [Methanoregulaceae archaeon]